MCVLKKKIKSGVSPVIILPLPSSLPAHHFQQPTSRSFFNIAEMTQSAGHQCDNNGALDLF